MSSIKHLFQSAKSDGGDASLVRPSNWNDSHDLSDFVVVGFVAECNTSPSGNVNVPWDAFYEIIDFDDLFGPQTGSELSYLDGVFTCLADGFYRINIGVDIVEDPGSDGHLQVHAPNYGYSPRLEVTSTGNATRWVTSWAFPMVTGQSFFLEQGLADVIDGYATMEIYRLPLGIA